MTTFTLQDLTPTKTEQATQLMEDNGMTTPTQININDLPVWRDPTPLPPTPTLESIVQNICTQLQLLASVIKEGQGNSQAGENSLQECVSTTLEQAEWFKEMVEEKTETLVDDMDHSYGIESAVETHFSNSFSLDDHVDITAEVAAEVESKVEDIAEDLLKDIVEERLAEIVSNKLQNLRITFD